MPSPNSPDERATQPTRARIRAARLVALGADAVQIAVAPLFGEGFASPFNDVLDLAVAGILIKLLGFHWAFLPALAAEAIPAVDLAPTWTAAVLLVTATQRRASWIAAAVAVAVVAAALLLWHLRR